MKKTLALILTLALLAALLSGCGGDNKKILGTWKADIDYAEYFNAGFAYSAKNNDLAEHFHVEEFIITTTMVFREDGSYSMFVDEESAEQAVEDLEYILRDGFESMLKEQYFQMPVSLPLEDWLKSQSQNIWDKVDQAMAGGLKDLLLKNMIETSTGKYRVEEGKFYMTQELTEALTEENYDTYTLEKDTLTILECHCQPDEVLKDVDGYEELFNASKTVYPITFHRVAEE